MVEDDGLVAGEKGRERGWDDADDDLDHEEVAWTPGY